MAFNPGQALSNAAQRVQFERDSVGRSINQEFQNRILPFLETNNVNNNQAPTNGPFFSPPTMMPPMTPAPPMLSNRQRQPEFNNQRQGIAPQAFGLRQGEPGRQFNRQA